MVASFVVIVVVVFVWVVVVGLKKCLCDWFGVMDGC